MTAGQSDRPWLSMRGENPLPVLRQATAVECGLACVAMIATYLGAATDLTLLRRRYPASLKGTTLARLMQCCADLDLLTRAVRCDCADLRQLRTPCILHWRCNHFVVLKAVSNGEVTLHDPARGVVCEPLSVVADAFTGVALEVSLAAGFAGAPPPRQLQLRDLVPFSRGISGQFLAGLLLSLTSELLLLAAPFYLQLIIDQVVGKSDGDLLPAIVAAFSILLVLQLLANILRQLTFQYLSHVVVFDLTTRLIHRLFKLPVGFFQSRGLGDIQHRVQSLERIQRFLVQSLPSLLIDTLFLALITAVMLLYDSGLTTLMLLTLFCWGLWRWLIFSRHLRLSSAIAQAEAGVQTHLLETLRAIPTVKLSNGERHRETEWSEHFATLTNVRIQAGNLLIVDNAIRQVLFQGVRIAAVYSLARAGLGGEISIGMISAFVAYLGMFATRGCGIIERCIEYKLLRVPLDRLADLVFCAEEEATGGGAPATMGAIELSDVSFSYAADEAPVLKRCKARFEAGRFTAIAGPSGSGKSTLLRLLVGTETASSGKLTLGDCPLAEWPLQDLRARTAAVLQGDRLMQGSVADNIALFAEHVDVQAIIAAAEAACIASDIARLPMGYETRIGDLGSSLSRGQVQRILLARAFYRKPQLLLLDEATSGLNRELELQVAASIAALAATRIVVTHSDVLLQAADTVLWLQEGTLLSSRPELNGWGLG